MSSPIPASMHYKHNKEKKTTEQSNNTSYDLQMFILTRCSNCTDLDCKGALDMLSRDKCGVYDEWLKLSETEKSKLFLASTVSEINLMEDITNEI